MNIPLPRKLSVHNIRARQLLQLGGIIVRVDGEVQDRVIEYDMDAGTVEKYSIDENGEYIVGENDVIQTEIVTGIVTVEHDI